MTLTKRDTLVLQVESWWMMLKLIQKSCDAAKSEVHFRMSQHHKSVYSEQLLVGKEVFCFYGTHGMFRATDKVLYINVWSYLKQLHSGLHKTASWYGIWIFEFWKLVSCLFMETYNNNSECNNLLKKLQHPSIGNELHIFIDSSCYCRCIDLHSDKCNHIIIYLCIFEHKSLHSCLLQKCFEHHGSSSSSSSSTFLPLLHSRCFSGPHWSFSGQIFSLSG